MTMSKNILMVVAPENFQEKELSETKKVLKAANMGVEIASLKKGDLKGTSESTEKSDKEIFEVNVSDYDAVVFIGGEGAKVFFDDPIALAIAEEAARQDKIVAAICVAPSILANAGVLQGKKATAFPTEESNLNEKGAIYTPNPLVVDGKIVTASGPKVAKDFGWKIMELLGK